MSTLVITLIILTLVNIIATYLLIRKVIPMINYIIGVQSTIYLIFIKLLKIDKMEIFKTGDLVLFLWKDLNKILLLLKVYINE